MSQREIAVLQRSHSNPPVHCNPPSLWGALGDWGIGFPNAPGNWIWGIGGLAGPAPVTGRGALGIVALLDASLRARGIGGIGADWGSRSFLPVGRCDPLSVDKLIIYVDSYNLQTLVSVQRVAVAQNLSEFDVSRTKSS